MKMCRWACGWTRRDLVRNVKVRDTLGVENISLLCRRSRLRWYGHVERREEEYVGKRVISMKLPGKRRRGRPKRRWSDNISEDMINIGAAKENAQDRDLWRRLSAAATPHTSGSSQKKKKKKVSKYGGCRHKFSCKSKLAHYLRKQTGYIIKLLIVTHHCKNSIIYCRQIPNYKYNCFSQYTITCDEYRQRVVELKSNAEDPTLQE